MVKKRTFWIVIGLILAGFGIGIYLQDLKHQESTAAAWKANRHNMQRFDNIQEFTLQLNQGNWLTMRDSILRQLDTVIILRFRKEFDSLQALRAQNQQID